MIKALKKITSGLLASILLCSMVPLSAHADTSPSRTRNSDKALFSVDTLAGSGATDQYNGSAQTASFRMPYGIAVLNDGSVLVTDSSNHLIRKISDGEVTTYAGFTLETDASGAPMGGWHDGAKELAVFNRPSGLTVDKQGNIYVADSANHHIRKISADGTVTTVAGEGYIGDENGVGSAARFYYPQDVAVAEDGSLYIADTLNHLIRQITPEGEVITLNAFSDRVVEIIGGLAVPAGDYLDGRLAEARFNEPTSIAIDQKGNLYVSDSGNHLIRYIDLTNREVSTVAGKVPANAPIYSDHALYADGGYADGEAETALFHFPKGIAITDEGGLLIADSSNHVIRYYLHGQVSTLAGNPTDYGSINGINGHHQLHHPTDVAVLANGHILIADSFNHQIRQLEYYQLPDLPQNDQVKVVFDSEVVSFDSKPEIIHSHTMVPLRNLSEMMGYTVKYDESKKTIHLSKGAIQLKLQAGSKMATVIKHDKLLESIELEAAPYIKNNRIYVPLRFFSEQFSMDVQWNKEYRAVVIREIEQNIAKKLVESQSLRGAKLEEINGVVYLYKSGGTQKLRAYNGMTLHRGDRLLTNSNSSAVIKGIDRQDEVFVGADAELYISDLHHEREAKKTGFVLWRGSIGVSAASLIDSDDTFVINTPSGGMGVRGTNFYVRVDPNSEDTSLYVISGIVQAQRNSQEESAQDSPPVFPSQQFDWDLPSRTNESNPKPYLPDLDQLFQTVSPDVFERLLRNVGEIGQENAELIEQLDHHGITDVLLDRQTEDLTRLRNNIDHLLGNLLHEAVEQNILDKDELTKLIRQANERINNRLDLNNTVPFEYSEQDRLMQERNQRMMENRRKLQTERLEIEGKLQKQNEELLRTIQAEREKQLLENNRVEEERRQRATDHYLQGLTEAERERFEQQQQEIEQQRQQQDTTQQSRSQKSPGTPSTPSSPPPTSPPTDGGGEPVPTLPPKDNEDSDPGTPVEELTGIELLPAPNYIDLSWEPWLQDDDVTYHIFINHSPDPIISTIGTFERIQNLEPATLYVFKITAVNSKDETVAFSEISGTTLAIEVVNNFAATTITEDSITVTWEAFDEFYNAILYLNGEQVGMVYPDEDPVFTFNGLASETAYHIRIEAWDNDFQSRWAANDLTVSTSAETLAP